MRRPVEHVYGHHEEQQAEPNDIPPRPPQLPPEDTFEPIRTMGQQQQRGRIEGAPMRRSAR